MTKVLRRVRGAVGMGVTWALGWAVFGLLIGVTSKLLPGLPWWDAFFRVFDAPLPALAVPGFVGGVIFSAVLGVVGRRRRFDELSIPRFAAWGAVGGLLLSMVPDTMAAVGLATLSDRLAPWQFAAMLAGPLTLLSAASAAGSLMLARKAARRGSHDVDDAGLAAGEAPEVLGGAQWSPQAAPARSVEERR
jgi:hypothetical protein